MRGQLVAVAVVGFVMGSACSSNNGTTTTGTSGGGTTTGGTGGNLAAGAACTSNPSCLSAVCGVNGSGHCCSAACATSDASCGATACDATGACTYPTSATACGDSCVGGMLTPGTCSGSGVCNPGSASACPSNLACNAAGTACLTQCNAAADCVTGFYCDTATNQCKTPSMTGACTSNAACTSGFCGTSGTGNCCAAQCMAATDAACNPTACDATGACVYPAGTACGTSACTGSTLSAGTCDATGTCNAATAACPNDLICNTAGTACLTTCTLSTDCVTGFYCNGSGTCTAVQATGACTSNAACASGVCGAKGSGNCCTAACSTTDLTCGATDCDATSGACVYPSATTSCGSGGSCAGGTETGPTNCDGAGACPPPTMTSCSPYVCAGTTGCQTSCSDNSSCSTGAFCETAHSDCCPLGAGGMLTVDSVNGNDSTACCGVGTHTPCQTLTHAMALITSAQATGVTITATVNGVGGDWAPAAEVYPIVLGWGVELSAPGVFFMDPNSVFGMSFNQTIFDVAILGPGPTDSASLIGTAASTINLGMNSTNKTSADQTDDFSVVAVETNATVYLANATLNGSLDNLDNFQAILVSAGATLILGQDQSTTVSGTVTIGNALGLSATDGWQGIVCLTDGTSQGCNIQDVVLVKQSSIVIQGQQNLDLDAEDFATVSLTSNPVFGIPPTAVGFTNTANGTGCANKLDDTGFSVDGTNSAVLLNGAVTMTLAGATVQCIGGPGVLLQSTQNGSPQLTIDSSMIQNTDLGIHGEAGTATVTNTTFQYNYQGVVQDIDFAGNTANGTIDLSGGGNTLICSSNEESSSFNTAPGIDAYNVTTVNLAADNVTWDTAGPDYFSCDNVFATCTCNLATCTNTAGNDGMDAVEDSTALGGITTTMNGFAVTTCN